MAGRLPIYKTVLVGEGGVGKTSITLRYTENRFDEEMKMTIGVNFASKKMTIDEANVTLMLWDLGGQPRFREVISDYFKGARIAIAVYDATRTFSLQRLSDWLERVKENAPDCQFIFVGNKIDERENGSGVTLEDDILAEMASKYNAQCMEVSAKTGDGITEMLSVKDDFAEYNEDYGSRLTINVATGSAATLSRMTNYISVTKKMHLSSHGYYHSQEGPRISMYGEYLDEAAVYYWSIGSGLCKITYLSACNSMGHNGIIDLSLANMIRSRTSVVSVVGFKDVANIVGATLLSQSFWGYHVTLSSSGGINSEASYTNTRDRILWKVAFIRGLGSIAVSVAVGYLIGLAGSGIGVIFISALLAYITSWYLLGLLLDDIESTVNNWEIFGDNVAGFYWGGGGGGGGGKDMPY